MTHLLPPSLLRLFAPRPPLEYVAPLRYDPDPHSPPFPKDLSRISKRKSVRSPLTGVASTLERIKQDIADRGESTDDIALSSSSNDLTLARVTLREIELEKRKAAKQEVKRKGLETYKPNENPEATPDAYKTLFLARLAYDVTEKDLHREFDMYGPIHSIRVVRDKEGKSRGYAFVAYERERDMKAAYKDAEGIKIHGRRVMVDVERGRTVKDWKPMRLGGGLGGTSRKPKKAPEPAEQPPMMMAGGGGFGAGGGGFRGGRGGFRGGRGGGFGGGRGGYGGPNRGGYGGGGGGAPRGAGGYDPGYAQRGGGGPPSQGGYPSGPPPPSRYGPTGGGYGSGSRDRDYPGPPSAPNGGGYPPRSYDDPSSGPPAKRSRY